jgi:prevent-host-death family protein
MAAVTSRELKNSTGAVLRRVRAGESITVTNRGRPIAVVCPVARDEKEGAPRTTEAIWAEIDAVLAATKPPFSTWRKALRRTRNRQ